MALSGGDKNISFHFQNLQNWYEIHFNSGGMEVVRVQNGAVPWISRNPTRLQNGAHYTFKLVLTEGRIEFFIDDVLIFDEVDPTFTDNYGKIGLKVGTGSVFPTQIRIDTVRVSLQQDNVRLGVPYFSQLDPQWRSEEYDSATTWAPADPSIGAWGCALSSMTMVMHYHDITTFADGTPLTPSTLNRWLLTQPDGYIGEGLLNWMAVTRLTNQLSSVFGTPSLEYRFSNQALQATLLSELETHHRPAVVNIPGHFLVAEGVVQSETTEGEDQERDFYILDPAYTHTQLSQHADAPLSLRLLTPSYTDLSYFLFVPTAATTDISLSTASELLPLTQHSEYLAAATQDTETSSPPQLLWQLQQPASEDYLLEITGTPGQEYSVPFYSYAQYGEVTAHTLTGTFGYGPEKYHFSFNKETGSTIPILAYSPTDFMHDIASAHTSQTLSSHFVWYELNRFAVLLDTFPSSRETILADMRAFIELHHHKISLETQDFLQKKLLLL